MVKALRWVAYITIGIAFIGGILAGNILAPEPEFSFEDKGFAWGYMLMFWVSGGISGIFTLGFASLLEHIENLSSKVDNIEASIIKKIADPPRTSAELISDLSKNSNYM
ncbi:MULTISPECIES: hypothetical protein [Paenibacillus]|uniref:hypothetical protein n=1 Tax=Paenibacillus TaxID=44249 RepID=UPI00096D68EE|nr:hypothetical protein [Paenibacillus odorifer]OME06761.1 hypothetical protein BSK60_32265 [Paenibacillus odorifer]